MTHKTTNVVSILILAIYVASMVYLFGNMYLCIENGKVQTEKSFEKLKNDIELYARNKTLFNDLAINKLRNTLDNGTGIDAFTINTEERTILAYPIESSNIDKTNDLRWKVKATSPFNTLKTTSVVLDNNMIGTLSAILTFASYDDFFVYARNTFFIIFPLTLIVFIMIIYNAAFHGKKQTKEKKIHEEKVKVKKHKEVKNNVVIKQNTEEKNDKKQKPASEETAKASESKTIETETNAPDEKFTEKEADEENISESGFTENIADSDNPQGLFSPKTGMGWESYLETRLDAELVRSASYEQDLSLFAIKVIDIAETEGLLDKIAQILIDAFKYRDLVFEYGQDGFVCILQNTDLNTSILFAEHLYEEMYNAVISCNGKNKLAIGISTRTLRLIPGYRLISEAVQALNRAFEEKEMPIVAFKVSPEKYRRFLSEENKKTTGEIKEIKEENYSDKASDETA